MNAQLYGLVGSINMQPDNNGCWIHEDEYKNALRNQLSNLMKIKKYMEECCDLRVGFRSYNEYEDVCEAIVSIEAEIA